MKHPTVTVIYYPEAHPPFIANTDEWGLIQTFDELDEADVVGMGIPRGMLAVVMLNDQMNDEFESGELTILESYIVTKTGVGIGETKDAITRLGNALISQHINRAAH